MSANLQWTANNGICMVPKHFEKWVATFSSGFKEIGSRITSEQENKSYNFKWTKIFYFHYDRSLPARLHWAYKPIVYVWRPKSIYSSVQGKFVGRIQGCVYLQSDIYIYLLYQNVWYGKSSLLGIQIWRIDIYNCIKQVQTSLHGKSCSF